MTMATLQSFIVGAVSSALVLGAACGVTPAAAQTPVFDHMKCYKIKDDAASKTYTSDLAPELTHDFQLEPGDRIVGGSLVKGCRIKVPAKFFCIDIDDQNTHDVVPPYNPSQWTVDGPKSGERLCYKLTCPKTVPKKLSIIDQFGNRDITLLGVAQYFCTPVNRQSLTTDPCELAGTGQCGGTCGEGMTCLATSPQDCGCVPSDQACAQTTGTCSNGFCGGVWETCVSMSGGICGCSHPP
jgi:hypothetical protein